MPMKKLLQNTTQNNSVSLIEVKNGVPDTITFWAEAYFRFEVTTSESSRREQKRDLTLFRDFMLEACSSEEAGSPRPFCLLRAVNYSETLLRIPDYGVFCKSSLKLEQLSESLLVFERTYYGQAQLLLEKELPGQPLDILCSGGLDAGYHLIQG